MSSAADIANRIALDHLAERRWQAEHAPTAQPRRKYIVPSTFDGDDVLLSIAPTAYVEALAGVGVPSRRMMCCPLKDHEDRTPSFRAYDDPEQGWYCYGCNRGGTIYDFASHLWGLPTRGPGFVELRKRLARELLRSAI